MTCRNNRHCSGWSSDCMNTHSVKVEHDTILSLQLFCNVFFFTQSLTHILDKINDPVGRRYKWYEEHFFSSINHKTTISISPPIGEQSSRIISAKKIEEDTIFWATFFKTSKLQFSRTTILPGI